ncbi:hypothetical protein [Methylobacterium nigriterrae]|uniref:hypothetical protein n=1 Tax=Methylobacterium nigriterrae TaxID=3127512 RepID=UPI00301348C8
MAFPDALRIGGDTVTRETDDISTDPDNDEGIRGTQNSAIASLAAQTITRGKKGAEAGREAGLPQFGSGRNANRRREEKDVRERA